MMKNLFPKKHSYWILLLACGFLEAWSSLATAQLSEDKVKFFETKIRPILAKHCYQCHGNDPDKVEKELVLTTAHGIRKGGQSGPVIVPGKPDKSLLILAIRHSNPDLQMPEDKLPREVIRDFERWVEQDAFDPRNDTDYETKGLAQANREYDFSQGRKHWAYQSLQRPELPEVDDSGWVRSPIDRFILSKLEEHGLKQVGPVTKSKLIRRLTYNLIGLPPTEEEIDDFLADKSPQAYEKVIDRLLDSDRYGERWGRHWLDVVRYADSNGGDDNIGYPNAFRYRDYVIKSFNQDKPYDQFVREQIAGDLLPDLTDDAARFDALTGTGFWMLGSKVLDLKDQEEKALNIIDEQLDVMGMAFIGQNIGCARCHDHKFDPIPTTDYYALAGILKSSVTMDENDERGHFMVQRPLATQSKLEAFEKAQKVITLVENELSDIIVDANDQLRLQRISSVARYLLAADQRKRVSENISSRRKQVDPSVLDPDIVRRLSDWLLPDRVEAPIFIVWNVFSDAFHAKDADSPAKLNQLSQSLHERAKEDPGSVSAYTLRMLESDPPASLDELAARYQKLFVTLDELLKAHLDFYLLREELDTQRIAQEKNTEIPENTKLSDYLKEQTKLTRQSRAISTKLDYIETRLGASSGSGVLKNLKAVRDHLQEAIRAQQDAQEKLIDGKARESVELRRQAHDFLEQASQRIQKLPKKHEERIQNFVDKVRLEGISRLLLTRDDSPFILTQKAEEQRYSKDTRSRIAKLRKNIDNLKDYAPTQPSWAVAIREAEEIVDLPVHLRGSHLTKVDKPTPRGFLRVMDHLVKPPRPPENQSGRLELARWLTDANHPLTARVMVNRIWQWHFGTGLVDTPNNFGTRGGEPSHPILLDYLATRFIELGWSVKTLNREIVLSNTYQLSTEHHAGNAEKDTDNKMLWRMNQRRLEVEPIRDALLALGGNLDLTMGGRVNQYKPGRGDRDRFVFSEGATWFRLKDELYIAPRRSVYLPVIRNALFPMFSVLDYADASAPIGNRSSTVIATQALLMMNSSFVIEQAERFARELLKGDLNSEDRRIETAFIRAYGRPPTRTEIADAKHFLRAMRQQASSQTSENDLVPIDEFAWSKLTHVMVSASEFIYID